MHNRLIQIATRSIEGGLAIGRVAAPDRSDWPAEFSAPRATFVTLTTATGGLRGCRGMLEPVRALGDDVWHNAFASAFDDPRFAPLVPSELAAVEIEISILSPLEPLAVASEEELRRTLVPGRDGVVLSVGRQRATFLPKVWESLPDVGDFLGELKRKAGLPRGFWSPEVRIELYQAECYAGTLVH